MKELSAGSIDMEIHRLSELYNPIFKRREIAFFIENVPSSSPRLYDVRKTLAEKNNAKEDAVFILRLDSKTGTNRTKGLAEIYDSSENAKQIIPKYIQLRNESNRHQKTEATTSTSAKKKAKKRAQNKKK